MPETSQPSEQAMTRTAFLDCVCCGKLVTRPSMGGWIICGLCDTGRCGGKQGHEYARSIEAERDAAIARAEAAEARVAALVEVLEAARAVNAVYLTGDLPWHRDVVALRESIVAYDMSGLTGTRDPA